jgi:hypothetical protein
MTEHTSARVVVGGKLAGYQGNGPGVIEEALMSIEAGQPLYAAGGFGGAAAAIARELGRDPAGWAPEGMPAGLDAEPVREVLAALAAAQDQHGEADDGLTEVQRRQLSATHRPGEIATLVVLGLALARRRDLDM